MYLWDVTSGELDGKMRYLDDFTDEVGKDFYDAFTKTGTLSISPNGTWAAISTKQYVYIVDINSMSLFGKIYVIGGNYVNTVAFHPNEPWIAVGLGVKYGTYFPVWIYNLNATVLAGATTAPINRTLGGIGDPSGHDTQLTNLAWHPTKKDIIASVSSGGTQLNPSEVIIWNATTETITTDIVASNYSSSVYGVAWSPSGANLVTVESGTYIEGFDNPPVITIRDNLGIPVETINGTLPINSVDFSPDGLHLVTGSSDRRATIWNMSGDLTQIFIANKPDYALYVNTSFQYDSKEDDYLPIMNNATLSKWNETSTQWELVSNSGHQASVQLGVTMFNEFAIPRASIGDPQAISIEVFSVGRDNATHAQDTVPADPGVFDLDYDLTEDKGLDWSLKNTSLGNFAYIEITNYSIDGIVSVSGNYHFGFHPSEILEQRYGTLGMLVVDSGSPGVYDTVYIDMNNDYVFNSIDIMVDKNNPIGWIDNFNRTAADAGDFENIYTPDGYPDISAGMLYFISDGSTPIPYSERYAEINGINDGNNNKTPANGEVLCFMGEFTIDLITNNKEDHGTKMASRLVSQGRMDTYEVIGLSPGAKIIAIGGKKTSSDVIASWYFAVEGYDGLTGTGDEAQIVVNGFNYPEIYESGWDDYSRTADYISMVYAEEKALFVMSAGDDGYGYGTVSAPGAGPGVLTVGSASDNLWRTSQGGGPEGSNHYYGDVPPLASRGPTAMGIPKPDVVAVSNGFVNRPLASVFEGTSAFTYPLPMIGSDHSAAVASSIACLVYQAYYENHGEYPNASVAKRLLMSGADDVGYDILTQGAGFLNANRSVAMATDTYGISSSHDFWVPGNYDGVSYDGFTSMVEAGDIVTETISLSNHGTLQETVNITDTLFAKIGENNFTNYTIDNYYYPVTDKNATDWYSPGEIVMWLNETGLSKVDSTAVDGPTGVDLSTTFQNTPVNVVPATPGLWERASMIRVTAYTDFAIFSELDESKLNHSYRLSLLDWEKGPDSNLNGNPALPVYFPCPSSEGLHYPEDLNIVSETYNMLESNGVISNVLETRITNPASRIHDGLVIYLNPTSDMMKEEFIEWNFKIEFFEKRDWDWLSLDSDALTISGNAEGMFDATISVPSGMGIGSYEGAISLHHNNKTVTDEPVLNVSTYSATDDPVSNSTDRIATLSHGNVIGLNLWKNATIVVSNESTYTTTAADEASAIDITFFTNNWPLLNLTLYIDLFGEWIWLEEGGDYDIDLATGQIDTLFGGVEEGWIFYSYYNYTYPAPIALTTSNYTLYPGNGTIILNPADALQPGESLIAEYSWYIPVTNPYYRLDHTNIVDGTSVIVNDGATLNEGVDYDLDHIAGVITFDSLLISTFIGNVTVNYTYYANSITIPVLINVGSSGDNFAIGNSWPDWEGLYNNSKTFGGCDYDMANYPPGTLQRPYTGDWRYYFVDIPDSTPTGNGQRLIIDVKWLNPLSDIDVLVYGKGSIDKASYEDQARYGPYTLNYKGGSEPVDRFDSTTNSSRETISVELTTGLNLIMIRNIILGSNSGSEPFNCTIGTMSIEPYPIDISTNSLQGEVPVTVSTTMDLDDLDTLVTYFMSDDDTGYFTDLEIAQDYEEWWNFPNWGEWMMWGSYTKHLNITDCKMLDVHILGHDDSSDLDLAVFRDMNGDGILNLDEVDDSGLFEYPPKWMYDADWDADERVHWEYPPDGSYIIKVLGFDTTGVISGGEQGGHFDMEISMLINATIFGVEDLDPSFMPANTQRNFNLTWDFPVDTPEGFYSGGLYVGPTSNVECCHVPIALLLDRTPTHSNEFPQDASIISNTTPVISIWVTDLSGVNESTIQLWINGSLVVHTITQITDGYNVSWISPGFELGVVECRIVADDNCSNTLDYSWNFTVLALYEIQLQEGWNLISLPLEQVDTSIPSVLASISGQWNVLKYYDNTDKADPWKTYRVGASTNDLGGIDNTMGFWINITEPNVNLTVSGTIPVSTNIPLYAGWNLVGYPTQTTEIVANALWGTGVDRVEVFNATEPYLIKEVEATYVMKPGEGYWVHVPADSTWTVDW